MSTTETSLFEGDQPSQTAAATTETSTEAPATQDQQSSIPQALMDLVGEGKKYKTVEEAINSIPHAQNHIATLTNDIATIKSELEKRKTAEELLEDIRKTTQQTQNTTAAVEVNHDVVSEIVRKQLADSAIATQQANNTALVVNTFKETYGDKAKEVFNQLAVENGMNVTQLEALVATSPQAVLKLSGITVKKDPIPTPSTGGVNTQAILNSNPKTANSTVEDYGKSSSVADGMRRAREIVNQRLNIKE